MGEIQHKSRSLDTKARLLEAAARVFASEGFEGATTREIARAADVNEVTLFRLFHTKENLQSAVLQRVLDQQAQWLAAQPKASCRGLREELHRVAQNYAATLNQNLPLIRTMVGEIHRHREHEERVLHSMFEPLKAEMLAILETARAKGVLRPGVDLTIAVTMVPGMIFTDILRRSGGPSKCPAYSQEEHLAACLDVFVRGIIAPPTGDQS